MLLSVPNPPQCQMSDGESDCITSRYWRGIYFRVEKFSVAFMKRLGAPEQIPKVMKFGIRMEGHVFGIFPSRLIFKLLECGKHLDHF